MGSVDAVDEYPTSGESDRGRRRVAVGRPVLAGLLAAVTCAGFAAGWLSRGGSGHSAVVAASSPLSTSPRATPGVQVASIGGPAVAPPLRLLGRWTTADQIAIRVYTSAPVPETGVAVGHGCAPSAVVTVEMSDGSAVGEASASVFSGPGMPAQLVASGVWGEVEGDPVQWAVVTAPAGVADVTLSFAGGTTSNETPTGGIAVFASHVSRVVGDSRFATFTARTSSGIPVPVAPMGSGPSPNPACFTPVTAPSATSPLPPPGPQPADPSAAKAAVVKAFTEFYTAPPAQALEYVQDVDQAVINANKQATAKNPGVTDVGVTVEQTVFTSPTTAAVRFDILVNGNPVLSGDTGNAALDNGVWKLTRATACADYSLGGAPC